MHDHHYEREQDECVSETESEHTDEELMGEEYEKEKETL